MSSYSIRRDTSSYYTWLDIPWNKEIGGHCHLQAKMTWHQDVSDVDSGGPTV